MVAPNAPPIPRKALDAGSPLPLSRLLLIFEYLLHNFYDPPMTLLEQVTWNLFTSYVMPSSLPGKQVATC